MRVIILVSVLVFAPLSAGAAGWWFEVGLPPGSYQTADGKTNNNMEWSPMLGPYNTYNDCDCWDTYMMKRFPVSAITGCMGFYAGGHNDFTCSGDGEKPLFIGK